jgi:hypothetical protein
MNISEPETILRFEVATTLTYLQNISTKKGYWKSGFTLIGKMQTLIDYLGRIKSVFNESFSCKNLVIVFYSYDVNAGN